MKLWKDWLPALVLAWVVPWVLVSAVLPRQPGNAPVQETVSTQPTGVREENREPVLLRLYSGGEARTIALEDYLTGVLLGEIPEDFHMEAKKAQAIVARTYTLRTVTMKDKHTGGICTDSTCCQAYVDPEEYLAAGGSSQGLYLARKAVEETGSLVLTYGGQLIDATYFSCSGGTTEDAAAVWGSDIPYLQSVDSPGEEGATHYSDTVTMTSGAFQAALGTALTGKPESWFGTVTYTQGGGVATMVIGGKAYPGTRLRTLLGLRSTAFRMQAEGDSIVITTKGFGHRVGMSQYGANAMAEGGSTCAQILAHYYTGTTLEEMEH